MISLLLPTRQRPDNLKRLVDSVNDTRNTEAIELVTWIDDDDDSYDDLELDITWWKIRGPRMLGGQVNLSMMWNECYAEACGDIVMHCGDDIVFRTQSWDTIVYEAFEAYPDKILFAYGRDGYQDGNQFGTHGFVHQKWIEAVGYLFPPLFVSDFNDTFLNDVAKLVGRHVEIDIYTEHMHYINGKAEIDQNTRERLERHAAERPDLLYRSDEVQSEIAYAANNLLKVMK